MPSCVCGRSFKSNGSLESHRADTDEHLCAICNLVFCGTRRFQRHQHWSCPQCDFICTTQYDLARHQKAESHWYCRQCGVTFDSKSVLSQHIKSPPHIIEFRCCDCDKGFIHAEALEQHMTYAVKRHEKIKARKKEAEQKRDTFHCEDCNRKFQSANAMRMHLNSAKHRPLSDLPCIGGLRDEDHGIPCHLRFTSPSAMLQHLESGSCPSGIDRAQLNSLILSNDPDHIITSRTSIADSPGSPQLFICGISSPAESTTSSTESGGVILTPGSELSVSEFFNVLPTVPSLRCPLCPRKRREFPSKKALDQHMQSLAHAATVKIFHCPLSLLDGADSNPDGKRTKMKQKKQKLFATASGLAQHIESGACQGGEAGLKTVIEYIEEMLRQRKLAVTLLV